MERNQSKKAKSFGAARQEKAVKQLKEYVSETHVSRRGVGDPPPLSFIQTVPYRRRWVQNAAVSNVAFTLADGHNQYLMVTAATGSATPIMDSWRIKKIHCWAVAGSDGSATGVTISPVGTDLTSNMNNDPEQDFTLSARSFTEPSYLCIKPSRFRPLGAWHYTSNTNFAGTLFVMNVTNNGGSSNTRVTLDIEFEGRVNLLGSPLGFGRLTATTSPGVIGGVNILSGFSIVGINNLG